MSCLVDWPPGRTFPGFDPRVVWGLAPFSLTLFLVETCYKPLVSGFHPDYTESWWWWCWQGQLMIHTFTNTHRSLSLCGGTNEAGFPSKGFLVWKSWLTSIVLSCTNPSSCFPSMSLVTRNPSCQASCFLSRPQNARLALYLCPPLLLSLFHSTSYSISLLCGFTMAPLLFPPHPLHSLIFSNQARLQ